MRYLRMLPGAPAIIENPVWIERAKPFRAKRPGSSIRS